MPNPANETVIYPFTAFNFAVEINVPGVSPKVWSGSGRPLLAPRPLRTGQAGFLASGSSIGQRPTNQRDAAGPLGLEGNLSVTTAKPAPEMPRWWQQHQRRSLRPGRHFCIAAQRRLVDASRPPTPRGSLPPFGWGNVATPLQPITDRHPLAPRSFTRNPIG